MENKISITVEPVTVDKALAAIAELNHLFPNMAILTPEQRHLLPKMGDKSIAFVEKTIDYASQNPTILPSFIDLAELKKDLDTVKKLNTVLAALKTFYDMLDDSALAAGSDAYTNSLAIYQSTKYGAKLNVPGAKGAYEDLKKRFPSTAKPKEK